MASARSTGSSPAPSHQHIRTHALASVQRSADGSRAYVEGIAYLSLDPVDGVPVARAEAELRIDSYVTWMRRATLERFAHQFLRHARAIDSQHDHREVGTLVESYITSDGHPTYPPGVWVTRIATSDPATLEALDKGELTGFSIEFVSPITIRVLDIEGRGKVRTGEITDPLPLYLSLVERPSIGIAFESVEVRSEQRLESGQPSARSLAAHPFREFSQTRSAPDAQALGRVTRLVSVNMDAHENKGSEGAQPVNASDVISTEAQTREGTVEQPKAEPAGTVSESVPALRSFLDAITPESRIALHTELHSHSRESLDWCDFAACWSALKDSAAMWDAFGRAFNLYDCVCCEIRWSSGSGEDGAKAAKVEKAAADFARVVSEIARAFPGYAVESAEASVMQLSARTEQRAGKKISAANMSKVQSARDACAASMGHLDELIALGATAEDAAESEVVQESEARAQSIEAQPATAPTTIDPTAIRAMVDAIVSERLAPLAAEHAKQLTELRASSATTAAELTQARADLEAANVATEAATKARTEAETARTVAQKRVADLEAMPTVPRSGTDETAAHDAGKTPAKRSSPFNGVLGLKPAAPIT